VVFAAVAIHFSKRVLESLFLHKYSGPIGLFTTLIIAGFYSLAAYLIGYLNRQPLQAADIWFYIGMALFITGILGNFIHHKILADLRKNTLDYIIPSGALFNFVICPHYLFEIVAWLGIFLVSRHLASLLILIFIIGYLTARSIRTLKWYKEKFTDFPAARKAILPFIL
jgi:very-long-chain enoyl-CoA reductase